MTGLLGAFDELTADRQKLDRGVVDAIARLLSDPQPPAETRPAPGLSAMGPNQLGGLGIPGLNASTGGLLDDPAIPRTVAAAAMGFGPGAGVGDYFGQFPDMQGGTLPSYKENIQKGNYGTGVLQALGLAGDLAYGFGPGGVALGAALKTPRVLQSALQAAARGSRGARPGKTPGLDQLLDARAKDLNAAPNPKEQGVLGWLMGDAPIPTAGNPNKMLEGADSPLQVSTAHPNASLLGNHKEQMLLQSAERMAMNPEQFAKNMQQMKEEPFGKFVTSTNPADMAEEFTLLGADNLSYMANRMPTKARDAALGWYVTANKHGTDVGGQHGLVPEASHGIMALFSPQTDWSVNVARHGRFLEMADNNFDIAKVEKRKGLDWVDAKRNTSSPGIWSADDKYIAAAINLPFDQLTNQQKLMRVTIMDAVRNPKEVPEFRPDGSFGDPIGSITWGSGKMIDNAYRIIRDPTLATVNDVLPKDRAKVPNFYNDLAAPKSKVGTATIDTHSAGGTGIFPAGQNDTAAYRAMGGGPPKPGLPPGASSSSVTGAVGSYGVHADAHRLSAKQNNILPRQVQSVGWEEVRSLWKGAGKTPKLKADIREIWLAAKTPKEARDKIYKRMGR